MKWSYRLCVGFLLVAPAPGTAQDALPPGDVEIFSAFHARLVEVSDLAAWGTANLTDRKLRDHARWMSGYTGKFARSIEEFLAEQGGAVQAVGEDSLVMKARKLRRQLETLAGRERDSAWAHGASVWLDDARVRAIFVDSKRLQHKKARGRESSLRWAWGEPYSRTCVMRERFERGRLACGAPPVDPAQGR